MVSQINKIYIVITMAFGLMLPGCDSGAKKTLDVKEILDTKDGVVVTTPDGDLYKIVGTELFEIKKHVIGYDEGFLKKLEYVYPSINAKLHCLVKAKVFSNKTDYIIEVTVVPNSIKGNLLAEKDILELNNGSVDGLSSIFISYEDADGFKLGEDEFNLNSVGWSHVINDKGEIYQYQYKGVRESEKRRAQLDSTMFIKWKGFR